MDYVMVPVPEELVDEVRQYMRWNLTKPKPSPWDADAIARILAEIDETSRLLLVKIARARLRERELTVAEAAAAIDRTARETAGLLLELNYVTAPAQGMATLTMMKPVSSTDPDASAWDGRVIMMAEDVAQMIVAADDQPPPPG